MKRGNLVIPMVTATLVLFGPGEYWSATWLSKWALLLFVGAAGLSIWAARATSLWHLPLLLYVFYSLLMLSAWPAPPYAGALDAVGLLALQKNAYAGLAEFALAVSATAWLVRQPERLRGASSALAALWCVGVAGTLCLPWSGPRSAPNNGLFLGNPSMGACLLACLLPFVWEIARSPYLRGAAWLGTFAAIFMTGASIPWGVLGAVTAVIWLRWAHRKDPLLAALGVGFLAVGLVTLGTKLLGGSFWQDSGRFEIWRMAWAWFRAHGSLWWGMGFSSSQTLVPLEQVITGHFSGSYFLWLHNDWLQTLIEGGVFGAACAGASYLRLLWLARKSPWAASWAGFCVTAVFNYPLRMPIHCFVLVVMVALTEALPPRQHEAARRVA